MSESKKCIYCQLAIEESEDIDSKYDVTTFSNLVSECQLNRQVNQEEQSILDQSSIVQWLLQNASRININFWDVPQILEECEKCVDTENLLRILNHHGVLIKAIPDAYQENKDNALFAASKYGTPEIISWVIEHGSNIKVYDYDYRYALDHAVEGGKLKNVIRLINLGANANESGSLYRTAIKYNHFHILKWLYENNIINDSHLFLDAFHYAIEEKQYDMIEWFVDNNVSVTESYYSKDTSIHFAAKTGNIVLIKWLLQKGAQLFTKNTNRETAVHIAAKNGHLELLKWLYYQGGNIDERIVYGFTCLHLASSKGHLHCVKFLIHNNCEINTKDRNGKSVLHVAAESKNNLELIQFLVQHNADIHALDDTRNTVLHYAFKNLELIKWLVENGCNPHKRNLHSKSVLNLVSQVFLYDSVKWLLEFGLDVDDVLQEAGTWFSQAQKASNWNLLVLCLEYVKDANKLIDNYKTLLHHAAPYVDTVKYLVENHNCDVNIVDGQMNTPLHIALQTRYAQKSAYYLIDKGTNVHLKNLYGDTVLCTALNFGNIEIIQKLLDLGSDVNSKNKEGEDALKRAISVGNIDILKLLIDSGADVNSKDIRNVSVLNYAAQIGKWEIVGMLIEKGADINHHGGNGTNLVHNAVCRGDIELVKWLLEHGARVDILLEGNTSILQSCHYIDNEVQKILLIQLLLQYGADINGLDYQGETILFNSVDNTKIIDFLLQNGINVNIQNQYGKTALHSVIQKYFNSNRYLETHHRYVTVQKLLNAGANINIKDNEGRSPLYYAVNMDNFIDIAKLLIIRGADINSKDNQGLSILHRTSIGELALLLCEKGANINAKDISGVSVLQFAIKNMPIHDSNSINIVKLLNNRAINNLDTQCNLNEISNSISISRYVKYIEYLINNVSNINELDNKGRNALHYTAETGNISVFLTLIEKGIDVFTKTKTGDTILHIAIANNRNAIVKYILENIDCTELLKSNNKNETPLHLAVQCDSVELVELIVKHVDIEFKNDEMLTALHIACVNGNLDIVKILVSNGANIYETTHDSYTALHLAVQYCRVKILHYLVDVNSEDILKLKSKTGETLLHIAVKSGKYNNVPNKIVKYLLEKDVYPIDTLDEKLNSALHYSCGTFMVDIVTMLVEKGANINLKNKDGNTPFHFAAKTGSIDIINYLLEKGGDINIKNKKCNTPVHIAAAHAKIKPVECLLHRGADLYKKNRKGLCLVHQLAISGGTYLFDYLLRNFDTTDVNVTSNKKQTPLSLAMKLPSNRNVPSLLQKQNINSQDVFGNTALHDACRYRNIGFVDKLLSENADVNIQNNNGDTPMHLACKYLGPLSVKSMIFHFCNIEIVNKLGWNILHGAASGKNVEVCEMLLSLVDKFTRTKSGDTVLHIACKNTDTSVFKFLVRNCGDLVNECNNQGDNVLHSCLKLSHHDVNMIQFLVENGADVESRNKNGDSVLHVAVNHARMDLVIYFIQEGMLYNVTNNIGNSLLHIAAENGYLDLVKFLLAIDCECLNSVNLQGLTALHLAAKYGQMSVVKFLVKDVHCDVDIKNIHGQTALELALEYEQDEFVKWFQQEK